MSKATFQDLDALMNASMDDIEDLPPVGVPPTGHYTLQISASREASENSGNEYIKFSYMVEAVNEVKNPEEEKQAAVGQKFSQIFSPFKKDGSVNEYGIAFLKEACAPFSAHFGTNNLGETIAQINKVSVAASLGRRPNKKEPDRFDFKLTDVVIL